MTRGPLNLATFAGGWPGDAATCRHAGTCQEIPVSARPGLVPRDQVRGKTPGWSLAAMKHGGAGRITPAGLIA